jgi:signal transduction histidine kinase
MPAVFSAARGGALSVPPLAAVAHELRTPLHGVLGCAELLAATPLDAEQRAHLAALIEAAGAALAFADDALALARLAADGARDGDAAHGDGALVPVRPVACDVRAVLAGVVRTLGPLAARRGLAVDWAADDLLPAAAWIDPRRVREVLLNLAGNAVHVTRRGGVRLRARVEAGGGLAVDVTDTGPGLTAEQQARLFRCWATGDHDDASVAGRGAGLGLVLARALAERMGGGLTLESAAGRGSTFTLRLPAADPRAPNGRPCVTGPAGRVNPRPRAADTRDETPPAPTPP